MKVSALRRAIREELVRDYLVEQDEEEGKEDANFTPEDVPGLPKKLGKLLDPDLSPAKFAKLDKNMDDSGTPAQQGGALAAYAISYADLDLSNPDKGAVQDAMALLDKAKQGLKQMVQKASDAAGETDDEEAGGDFQKDMAQEGIARDQMEQIIREEITGYYMGKLSKISS